MSVHDWVIYQLLDSRGPGGIETHVLNLSCWLNDHGYRNEVIFLKDHGAHPLKDALSAQGVHWRCLERYSDLGHVVTHTPSLLCTHGYKAGILGRLVGRFNRTPVVSTYHSGDRGRGKLRIYSWLDEITALFADRVISVSAEISARLPVSSQQIVNFIGSQKLPHQRGKAVAFVGRLSEEKGPESFARATLNLETPCHVYGDGPLRDELQSAYKHLRFFGHVDMQTHWSEIGLLCITSSYEGLPLVALEAMVRGIPVASYAIGGLPELIEDQRTGWLVPPRDETTLNKTIQLWSLKSPTDKAAMAVAAHHHIARHYSDDSVCPKIIALYKQAIQHKGALLAGL